MTFGFTIEQKGADENLTHSSYALQKVLQGGIRVYTGVFIRVCKGVYVRVYKGV